MHKFWVECFHLNFSCALNSDFFTLILPVFPRITVGSLSRSSNSITSFLHIVPWFPLHQVLIFRGRSRVMAGQIVALISTHTPSCSLLLPNFPLYSALHSLTWLWTQSLFAICPSYQNPSPNLHSHELSPSSAEIIPFGSQSSTCYIVFCQMGLTLFLALHQCLFLKLSEGKTFTFALELCYLSGIK